MALLIVSVLVAKRAYLAINIALKHFDQEYQT